MKSILTLSILLFLVSSCSEKSKDTVDPSKQFTKELQELKEYFQIPGLAVAVEQEGSFVYEEYFGVSDLEKQTQLEATTVFPIASITKVFSGVLIMKLVEEGKLSLDEPVNTYLPKPLLEDSVLVKHVLSHTSQGKVGEEFYYSSRFGLLTQVIEMASGKSFADAMNDEILAPLALKNTFLLKDSTQLAEKNKVIAKPYFLDNGVENGFIDYGYSASAGVVSNLSDLSLFNRALDNNTLLSQPSKDAMFSSFGAGLPYGYGIFSQEFQGLQIVWAYGQYDCHSSLLLKIPEKNITVIALANNNLMSDPARLIYGDVTSSMFAMSFLKNYVLGYTEMKLFEATDAVDITEVSNKEFCRKKLLAQALAESFMARFDATKMQSSAKLLNTVFTASPDYLQYADLNLLHTLTFLKSVAFYRDLGEFNEFDTHIEAIGEKLLHETPNNPYVHSYMGTYYDRKGNVEKARYHFESIVNAHNFSRNWYTQEAENWLNENK
ncbi:serine hydrolase [Aureisphaera galaxeae]|uniref:serine hydrolase domain-containing protein n=1 Tax=Aureisphaera galaxeae TaxID=1538023 RepID=UPI00234FC922|nr:serine hydrolase domain-containing protein [Aureisphaera galaxeae]MDC8003909.1 serine hydrolase [Aureisphaera galaxeae]